MAQNVSSPDVPYAGGAPINTFENPNYLGELFNISPRETPFVSLIGGVGGAEAVAAKDFVWQLEADEGDANGAPAGISEGQDPTYSSVGRGEVSNTIQIFQYGLNITYSKLGATQQLGPVTSPTRNEVVGGTHPISGTNAITNELARQTSLKLARMAKDVEKAFLSGTFQRPLTAAEDGVNGAGGTERQTQGIIGAVATANAGLGGTATLSADINTAMLHMFDTVAAPLSENYVIMVTPTDKVKMTNEYAARGLLLPGRGGMTAGLRVEELVTDFGQFPIVVNRWMPANTALLVNLGVCKAKVMPIPGKGTVFTEELAHTGAALNYQLYGELGLEYGPPQWHATIDTTSW
jgi:hypothetical protein